MKVNDRIPDEKNENEINKGKEKFSLTKFFKYVNENLFLTSGLNSLIKSLFFFIYFRFVSTKELPLIS